MRNLGDTGVTISAKKVMKESRLIKSPTVRVSLSTTCIRVARETRIIGLRLPGVTQVTLTCAKETRLSYQQISRYLSFKPSCLSHFSCPVAQQDLSVAGRVSSCRHKKLPKLFERR